MKKKRRNELYDLIAQVVSENPKLASGSLKRLVSRRRTMKTLLEQQDDAYWQSVNKLKEADEILRNLDTTGWPWLVQQQLEKTRVQLMLTRQQITGGLAKSANS